MHLNPCSIVRRHCSTAIFVTLGAALALPLASCTTNPATGDRFFSPLSRDQEIAMGVEAKPEMTKEFGGEIGNARIRAYVNDIGRRLAATTEADNPSLPWEFIVLDSSVINAFALPGGKVFVSRGLMERMTNEAQLAGVLGHEIGHVTAQHSARRIGQATLIQGGVAIAGVAVGAAPAGSAAASTGEMLLPALNVGGEVIILKFGRDEESQADSLGLRYMSRIGYNPTGQLQVMEILKDASKGGGGQPEFLSTHPLPETRIKRLQDELKKSYAVESARTDNYFEARFSQQCLAVLKSLPPPTQKAQATAARLVELATAAWSASGHPDGCPCGTHTPVP